MRAAAERTALAQAEQELALQSGNAASDEEDLESYTEDEGSEEDLRIKPLARFKV